MPPSRTNPVRTQETRVSPLPLVARFNGRSVMVPRRTSFESATLSIKAGFKELTGKSVANAKIRILAKLPTFGDERIQISSETWADLVGDLREVWIEVDKEHQEELRESGRVRQENTVSVHDVPQLKDPKIRIKVEYFAAEKSHFFVFLCEPSTTMGQVMLSYARRRGICEDTVRLLYGGDRVDHFLTVADLGLPDGAELYAMREQVGGKPVVYLFPPNPLSEVNVQLSLIPSWSFSALYPSTPVESTKLQGHEGCAQSVSWIVSAEPDGTLTDKASKLQISYLFWEAHTKTLQLASPPDSRPPSPSVLSDFDPARACDWLKPETSVVLPTNSVPAYLDATLKALTLHTEARTSFITYWLPSLLKHSEVVLRFLPQSAYEDAAPLSIVPRPDVVTRVFMVFRGVAGNDKMWDEARARASINVEEAWKDAVGVDSEKALDTSLFRVLEWGGMEVVNGW